MSRLSGQIIPTNRLCPYINTSIHILHFSCNLSIYKLKNQPSYLLSSCDFFFISPKLGLVEIFGHKLKMAGVDDQVSSLPNSLPLTPRTATPMFHHDDQFGSLPITPRTASVAQTPSIVSLPITPRTAATPSIVSLPPSQLHSPSLSRSPLLHTGDHVSGAANRAVKTPRSRGLTPRFITPLGSPLRKALKMTRLDPQDAWLPITESRNGNAYYAAFHTLCSGIGIQALVLPVAFTILGWYI